jgi:hypothetical protein
MSGWKLMQVALDPGENVVPNSGRLAESSPVRGVLPQRVLDLVQSGRNRRPEEQHDHSSNGEEEGEDRRRCCTRCRLSHSTPGRIAAANVNERSRRITMLLTSQMPKPIAPTAIAAAVAFAVRRTTSRSRPFLVGRGRRFGVFVPCAEFLREFHAVMVR